ncbi:MAG: DUF5691 domain-containing protein [Xanthobacteraceae bacterium]
MLALAGQAQRFVRPQGVRHPIPEAALRMHQDPRPILSNGGRRALRRLASSLERGSADAVLRAVLRRIGRAGFRLHPFDLPKLVAYIRDDGKNLGIAERAYLSLVDRSTRPQNALHADITAENWTEFPKGHRVAFVASVRRQHPAAGRALVADALKSEAADMRGVLLEALAAGLEADDLPLLEAATTDRAESVRAAASRLIARVPGTPAYLARLAEAARCFTRSTTGLAGALNRVGLLPTAEARFVPPPAPNPAVQTQRLHTLFEGLPADDVAAAAGLTLSELLNALPADDVAVLPSFAATAGLQGRNDLVARFVEHKLFRAAAGSHLFAHQFAALAGQLIEPLAIASAEQLLASPGWRAVLQRLSDERGKDDGTLVWAAVMLPDAAMPLLLESLAPLSPATTRSARDFAELVMTLR